MTKTTFVDGTSYIRHSVLSMGDKKYFSHIIHVAELLCEAGRESAVEHFFSTFSSKYTSDKLAQFIRMADKMYLTENDTVRKEVIAKFIEIVK